MYARGGRSRVSRRDTENTGWSAFPPRGGRSRVSRRDTERMQNEYKSPISGKLTKIFIQEGAAVETGAPMVMVLAAEE